MPGEIIESTTELDRERAKVQQEFDRQAIDVLTMMALREEVDRLGGNSQEVLDRASQAWQEVVDRRQQSSPIEQPST